MPEHEIASDLRERYAELEDASLSAADATTAEVIGLIERTSRAEARVRELVHEQNEDRSVLQVLRDENARLRALKSLTPTS